MKIPDKYFEILNKKGSDYSPNGKFNLFNSVAEDLRLTPDRVILVMIFVKIKRMQSVYGRETNFESFKDSVDDLICYTILLYELCFSERPPAEINYTEHPDRQTTDDIEFISELAYDFSMTARSNVRKRKEFLKNILFTSLKLIQ